MVCRSSLSCLSSPLRHWKSCASRWKARSSHRACLQLAECVLTFNRPVLTEPPIGFFASRSRVRVYTSNKGQGPQLLRPLSFLCRSGECVCPGLAELAWVEYATLADGAEIQSGADGQFRVCL